MLTFKLFCTIYKFTDPELPLDERNFYNPDADKSIVTPEFDITEYLTELPKLTFNKITRDEFSSSPSVVTEYGDLRCNFTGIRNSRIMQSIFRIYDTTNQWALYKYYFRAAYGSDTVFKGFLDIDSVKMPESSFTNLASNKIISANIISRDKEFNKYIETRSLPNPNFYFNGLYPKLPLPWYNDSRSEDNHSHLCSSAFIWHFLYQLLDRNFTIQANTDYAWEICNIPQLFNSVASGNWFVKSGYKRFWQESYTIKQFIQAMCNSFGWTFEFHQYEDRLILAERRNYGNGTLTIPYSLTGEKEISNKYNKGFKHILIPAGGHQSQTGIAGFIMDDHRYSRHYKLISNSVPVNNQNNQFLSISGNAGVGQNYQYALITPLKFKYQIKDEDSAKYIPIGDSWLIDYTPYTNVFDFHNLRVDDTLILDAGSHSAMKTICNLTDTHNYASKDFGADWQDQLFDGNVGDCFVVRNSLDTNKLSLDYHAHCKTDNFLNNFAALLDPQIGKNTSVVINTPVTKPYSEIIFTDAPEYYTGRFVIQSIETDFQKRNSKLSISKLSTT